MRWRMVPTLMLYDAGGVSGDVLENERPVSFRRIEQLASGEVDVVGARDD